MQTEALINKYLTAFFILALGGFLFAGLTEFFSAFLGAIIFYILFKKFMCYLTIRRNFNKPLAAIIIILISFLIVILPMGILIGMIYKKVAVVAEDPEQVKTYIDALSKRMDELPIGVSFDNLGGKVANFISSHAGGFISSSFNVLASLLMMYFLLYFLLMNVLVLEQKLLHFLPFDRDKIKLFGLELQEQTYANAIGVPVVGAAQGLAAYGSYLIVGLPDAGLLGILTGFASIIPLVGTAIIWLPVAVYLFANGDIWQGFFMLLYSAIFLGSLDNLIRMIVSKKIGDVHPVITVLGVILGLKFFGLPGLVFGPLLISYLMLLIKIYHVEYNVKVAPPEEEIIPEENVVSKVLNKMLVLTDIFGAREAAKKDITKD